MTSAAGNTGIGLSLFRLFLGYKQETNNLLQPTKERGTQTFPRPSVANPTFPQYAAAVSTMSSSWTVHKLWLLRQLQVPDVIVDCIMDFGFRRIRRIAPSDERYAVLYSIPKMEFHRLSNSHYVYLGVEARYDFMLTYFLDEVQLIKFGYDEENNHRVLFLGGTRTARR
jgi:hypothetical protein